MKTNVKYKRVNVRCECCDKEFFAAVRLGKRLQRYCSGVCQRESNVPHDLPDEAEIKRRAGVIKYLREERGINKITHDMLDWY